MRKYGKWVLTLGLLAATPGLTLAAGAKSTADDKPAADGKTAGNDQNQKVAEEIAKAMKVKRIQGSGITIEFKGGVATLSGSIVDAKMKEAAQQAALKVNGVKRVENRMKIVESPRVMAARPAAEPAATGGGVVSANHTASAAKPSRVQQVNNEVTAAPSANQETAELIGAALTSANLNGYDIEIRYQNGVALLQGKVGTQAERATAERVVSQIPGIQSVANRLTCMQEPDMAAGPPGQRMPYAPGPQGGPYAGGPPGGQFAPGPQGGQYAPGPRGGQYAPGPQGGMYPAGYRQGEAPMPGAGGMPPQGMPPQGGMPMAPGMPMPPQYGHPGMGASQAVYNNPSVPDYAWPSYAQYPNVAAVSYPQQYSASAWPYIGPFYPYPQVPMGWRDATLRWDDGQWNLMFRTRTDKWWWYFNPNNW